MGNKASVRRRSGNNCKNSVKYTTTLCYHFLRSVVSMFHPLYSHYHCTWLTTSAITTRGRATFPAPRSLRIFLHCTSPTAWTVFRVVTYFLEIQHTSYTHKIDYSVTIPTRVPIIFPTPRKAASSSQVVFDSKFWPWVEPPLRTSSSLRQESSLVEFWLYPALFFY